MRADIDRMLCDDCKNTAASNGAGVFHGVPVPETGELLCAKCGYARLRNNAIKNPTIGPRLLKNRQSAVDLAMSRTRPGEACPRDCWMYRNEGCALLDDTYEQGACPFYQREMIDDEELEILQS